MTAFLKKLICIATAAVAVCSAPTFGQEKRLVGLKIEPLSIRGRSGSPIPLQIKLEYNAPQLLEGDLLLEIYNSFYAPEDLMAKVRYEGIVLQGNDYIFNTILPPLEHSDNKQYQIVAWFDTGSERLSLSRDPKNPEDPHDLLSIGAYDRATLLCSVSGKRDVVSASSNRAFLSDALSLEKYDPNPKPKNVVGRRAQRASIVQRIQHFSCNWDAYNLPEDPLYLCAFDVVLLADGSLSRLEDIQLRALQTWVEAGGSLCVLPDDDRLTGSHLQFLQTLLESADDPSVQLLVDERGKLQVISEDTDVIVQRRFGLGRVTLLPNVPDLKSHLSREQVGAVVGHLWKVRSDSPINAGLPWGQPPLETILRQQGIRIQRNSDGLTWHNPRGNMVPARTRYESVEQIAAEVGISRQFQPRSSPLTGAAETGLLPEGVRMVPTSVIAMLLIAYVITIGPVDYFLLGFFKARKYTWVLFPVVTAAFTAITVNIAHQYMASSDTGGRISVVDLVDNGRPVRQTDLQMHFYASQTSLNRELSRSFVVPAQMVNADMRYGGRTPQSFNKLTQYSGRFPQTFRLDQNMRQWEPQLNRTMTFSPSAEDVPELPWGDMSLVTTEQGRQKLRNLLSRLPMQDRQVDAVVLHGGERHSLFPYRGFMFSANAINEGKQWVDMQIWERPYRSPPRNSIMSVGVLESSSRSGRQDYFDIVSQVSPQGSASTEDLPILDESDASQWLLLVAVRDGQNTTVYRRLFYTDSPEATTGNPTGEQAGR